MIKYDALIARTIEHVSYALIIVSYCLFSIGILLLIDDCISKMTDKSCAINVKAHEIGCYSEAHVLLADNDWGKR